MSTFQLSSSLILTFLYSSCMHAKIANIVEINAKQMEFLQFNETLNVRKTSRLFNKAFYLNYGEQINLIKHLQQIIVNSTFDDEHIDANFGFVSFDGKSPNTNMTISSDNFML